MKAQQRAVVIAIDVLPDLKVRQTLLSVVGRGILTRRPQNIRAARRRRKNLTGKKAENAGALPMQDMSLIV